MQALADYAASLGDVTQVIHTSGVSPSDTATENIIRINAIGTVNMVEAFYPTLSEGGVMINFSSVAAYTHAADGRMDTGIRGMERAGLL